MGAGDAGDASTLTPVRSPSPTLAVRVGWGKTNGPARVMRSHFGASLLSLPKMEKRRGRAWEREMPVMPVP